MSYTAIVSSTLRCRIIPRRAEASLPDNNIIDGGVVLDSTLISAVVREPPYSLRLFIAGMTAGRLAFFARPSRPPWLVGSVTVGTHQAAR
eukprot:scaffold74746_cov18-Prasinocladus_malaysianus.AAC.3